MNTLKIVGCIVLMVIAVWVCVRYRRVFVIQRGPEFPLPLGEGQGEGRRLRGSSVMVTLCKSLLCLALLGLASWAGYYAVTTSTGWTRNAFYTFLPIIVLTSYVYPIWEFKNLPKEWKRSPLFILTLLAPILGCAILIGVLCCEVGRPRYS